MTDAPTETRTSRVVYHVLPYADVWRIELAGDSLSEHVATKQAAIERAKVLARRSPRGRVVVLDAGGEIEQDIELDNPSAG